MSEAVSQTLVWVNEQLATTLQEARQALEDFIERPDSGNSLVRCADRLHQAHGALKLTEVEGGALLADEMERVARSLSRDPTDARRRAECLDSLTRAMVQLPAYMDRVISGGADIPLVLLPLLNDLRAARGRPLLSENTLVLLYLPSERGQIGPGDRPRPEEAGALRKAGRRLRSRYQSALLGWIRGENPDSSLATMADIMEDLERASTEERSYQLWWVAAGVIEAIRQGGLESSASVKRLLGQVDQQIRRLVDEGERAIEADPPFELVNSLLFYVARTTSQGRRVGEIRKTFSLADLMPAEQQLEEARDSLSAPSIKLMQTVGAAIREDLTRVKDVLDIFVRTGMSRIDELSTQLDLLNKIGETLGVLGVPALKDAVQAQEQQLRAIVAGTEQPDEEGLLAIAAVLIEVESNLDDQLVSLVVDEETGAGGVEDLAEIESHRDFEAVTSAVLEECIENLDRVKEAIVHSIEAPLEPRVLDEVPYLLKGITAGLLMLDRTRAVSAVERIGAHIRRWLGIGDAVPSQLALDRLADAIVSVEYYMETIQGGRSDPMYMLDNAEGCLSALDAIPREPVVPPAPRPAVPVRPARPELEAEAAEALEAEAAATEAEEKTRIMPAAAAEAAEAAAPDATVPMPALKVGPEPGRIEPELLELFIDEAGELAETLSVRFPLWQSERDPEALTDIRRQFHTLKGSGRMVGAELIGEFAWAVENLLNRLISGTVECTEAIVSFVGRAVEGVPALVEQLESGAAPALDVQAYIVQAHAFAEGRPEAEELLARTLAVPEPAVPEVAAEELDPVLREIFTKEASEHLKSLQGYLEARQGHRAPHSVTEELHRACHTLSGSANMAGVAPAVAIAAPLNQLLRRLHEDRAGLDEAALRLFKQAVGRLGVIIEEVREGHMPVSGSEELAEALRQAYAEHVVRAEAAVAEAVAEAEPVPAEEVRLDPEIAAIFCDEAGELLDNADAALSGWRHDTSHIAALEDLQRHLHTLKGGARLAGVMEMGDLSHRLESVVSGLVEGRIEAPEEAADLIQASLDQLHGMREVVESGRLPTTSGDLEGRLEALLAGREVVAEPEPEAEVEIQPEAVEAEPEPAAFEELPAVPEIPPRPALPAEFIPPPAAAAQLTATQWAMEAAGRVPAEAPPEFVEPEIEAPAYIPPAASAPPIHVTWRPAAEAPPPEEAELPAPEFEEAPTELPAPEFEEAPVELFAEPTAEPAGEIAGPEQIRVSHPGIARPDIARVDADLLESLLNNAGEVSIFRSRLEQQVGSIEFNLEELGQTVIRLRDQLRKLEMETEAQILHRHHERPMRKADFDPLEMDQYSMIQQLSRALAETSSDVASLQQLLGDLARDADTLLTQQARVISELQDGLMRTRMVPFSRYAQRLIRIVRQAARENGKQAELRIRGGTSELDRQVMERAIPAFEHMLRNAVIHGVEAPELRAGRDKPITGRIDISLRREGAEMIIEVADDGAGLDLEAIRRRAELQNLIRPGQPLSEDAAADLILRPGFSTAMELTQAAGRGVGMDVVATAIRDLGGSLQIATREHEGTRFLVRLPYTRAITQALLVRCGEENFALPLPTVEGVVRLPAAEIVRHLGEEPQPYRYGEREYHFRHLGTLVGAQAQPLPTSDAYVPVILVRAGERSTALLTDELIGSREIVVKTLGPQFAGIRGVSGATILGDGSIVVILDAPALLRGLPEEERIVPPQAEIGPRDHRTFVMVVDDSITVRRVTERLLERNGMRVITAKDGVDAVSLLQDHLPDIILLDIEMPRMDGYEVATHVRNDPRLKNVPIVMITSRVGKKHRTRALETGVDDYLGKPYQESELLAAIEALTGDLSAGGADDD